MEPNNASFCTVAILLNGICRCFCLVNKVGVEYIEFVPLNNFWRRIVMVVVSLIVLVPLISSVNTIEIFWLSWTILVMPPINLPPNRLVNFMSIDNYSKENCDLATCGLR